MVRRLDSAAGSPDRPVHRSTSGRSRLVAALIVFLLLVAGCTNNDADNASDTTTSSVAETSDAGTGADDETTTTQPAEDPVDEDPVVDLQVAIQAVLDALGASGVEVTVDGDVVTLSGSADSNEAEAILSAVRALGDYQVVNDLSIVAASIGGVHLQPTDKSLSIGGVHFLPVGSFDVGSVTVPAADEALLDEAAVLLLEDKTTKALIEGHTDSAGSEADNLVLSQRRADSARDYLIDKGVSASQIIAVGKGESEPLDGNNNASEEEKASNRRIEVTVLAF